MLEMTRADEYFALHLKGGDWAAQSEETRRAALAMAEQDVSLELGGSELDYDNLSTVAAVCEQALFLLLSPDDAINPAAALLLAESVEGIGSRTFRSGGKNPAIAPRAARFIEQIRGRPGIVNINRG